MLKNWIPLKRSYLKQTTDEQIKNLVDLTGATEDFVRHALDTEGKECEYWINDIYQVQVNRGRPDQITHLNIRRRDGKPIFRDWRHFQQIKNELVGEECEAMELYHAESRKVDSSNKYHLYAIPDPTFRFPVGFAERDVSFVDGATRGTKQRGET